MAISLYDQPAEMQLIDTYVPAPIKELAAAAQVKQQRYDKAVDLEDRIYSQLGETPALSEIVLPSTGRRVAINDAKLVRQATSDYESRIGNLAESYKDKSSPEYQQEIRKVIRDLRKDFSPQGTFGQAKQNVEAYRSLQESKVKDSDILSHRYSGIESQLLSGVSQDRMSRLAFTGGPGKGANITKSLSDLLKNVKTTLGSNGTYSYKDEFGRVVDVKSEEVNPNRIRQIVAAEMQTNPALIDEVSAITRQAQLSGQDFNPSDYINQVSNIMASTFAQQDLDIDKQFDPYALSAFREGLKTKEEKVEPQFSYNVLVQDAARKGVSSPFGLKMEKEKATKSIDQSELQLAAIENQIPKTGPNAGMYIVEDPVTGEKVDKTIDYRMVKDQLEVERAKLTDLQSYEESAKRQAGLTDDQLIGRYTDEQITQAKLDRKETITRENQGAGGVLGFSPEAMRLEGDPESWKEFLPKDKFGKTISERRKEYKRILDDDAELKAREISISEIPKDVNEYFESDAFKASVTSLPMSYAESERSGELPLDDRESIDPEHTIVKGWAFDSRTGKGGQVSILADVYEGTDKANVKGEKVGSVSIPAPQGFREHLLQSNEVSPRAVDFEVQLLKALGTESSYSGQGTVTLGYKPDTKTSFNIVAPDRSSSGKWEVYLPSSESGLPTAIYYDGRDQMINAISTYMISRENKQESINQNTANKKL